ncbi:hypothetical protein [Frigidibacter sp. ROC022]|uniref:hypothetical protein n=1 Tax=Frigidibacter sp. ROC022 TaxID=2971796 RepID=UPI00215AE1BE|nr:hypothetical protein [Frigidibacter sp. ROC022]MCR8725053.1 hypothetical protein [Frigidibacter sp. ROC022]
MIRNAIAALAILAGAFQPEPAAAQSFDPTGNWSCSLGLYEQGLQPYGYEAELVVNPDGGLYARGAVYNPNLQNSVQPFEGPGDWIAGPTENGMWVRLRIHTRGTHGILVFEGAPTGPGTIYRQSQGQNPGSGAFYTAEMQCTRMG